jgi:hypothetical protein
VQIPVALKFTAMVRGFPLLVEQMQKTRLLSRTITLDDAAKAKSVFDGY